MVEAIKNKCRTCGKPCARATCGKVCKRAWDAKQKRLQKTLVRVEGKRLGVAEGTAPSVLLEKLSQVRRARREKCKQIARNRVPPKTVQDVLDEVGLKRSHYNSLCMVGFAGREGTDDTRAKLEAAGWLHVFLREEPDEGDRKADDDDQDDDEEQESES